LNPGPSGEDADISVGQPRDVGSPVPRQSALGSADIGARSIYFPPTRLV